MLCRFPAHVRSSHPAETKCALDNKNCHISQSVTHVFDLLMPTHGNGDLCSKPLCNAINWSHMKRAQNCCSFCKAAGRKEPPPACVEKDCACVAACPPLGDGIRDACDVASSSNNAPWMISDHDWHARETQGVACDLIFAQDHAFEVTKNCFQNKQIGAAALWDVSTEAGEIASAVLVPSTKTAACAHAATQMSRRPSFNPSAKHRNNWPAMNDFWRLLFGLSLQGRLGLFHHTQRITMTLKKNHTDHFLATSHLPTCICHHNLEDHENLLRASKEGSLSGTKHSDQDMQNLRSTKHFRQRCDKHSRKEMRLPHVLCSKLDDWFDRHKCSVSDNARPAGGRKDPNTGETLFTPETKEAIRNCKEKAKCVQHPPPLDQMHDTIKPSPNAAHQLNECVACRGESCLDPLEAFHNMLEHFGNCGMRSTLADNLNLTGTATCNLTMRHKRRLTSSSLTPENPDQKKTPAAFESLVSCFNHSELAHANRIAVDAGAAPDNVPFENAETLLPDNGERFFSDCLIWKNTI